MFLQIAIYSLLLYLSINILKLIFSFLSLITLSKIYDSITSITLNKKYFLIWQVLILLEYISHFANKFTFDSYPSLFSVEYNISRFSLLLFFIIFLFFIIIIKNKNSIFINALFIIFSLLLILIPYLFCDSLSIIDLVHTFMKPFELILYYFSNKIISTKNNVKIVILNNIVLILTTIISFILCLF